MQILFQPPTEKDVTYVASHMRRADVEECMAGGYSDVHSLLADEVRGSLLCWAVRAEGTPVCILGVTPLLGIFGDTGIPWMLGTDLVTVHRRALVRTAPKYIAKMQSVFPHLLNYVHAENTQAVRWLKTVGFVLDEPAPFGPCGALFHRFEKRI